ncbi:MAG: 30S ribosomal protein S2 [Candidatus Aenigmatarchaeota archaeon]|nr:30S ribosomal protein S2 [Candidatus Aenigmarchaeota archaeon]
MPYENYLSSGMHIGMRQTTADMKRFVYKIREDGLAILDLATIEKRIQIAAAFIAKFNRPLVVSRKLVGHRPVTKFAETIGGKAVIGRFLPGTITNPAFPGYYEPDVVIITDPLVDKQAIIEAMKARIPIVSLCDTLNETACIDLIIPVNNKGRKAIAMVYWLLAREILKVRGTIKADEEFTPKPEEFEMAEAETRIERKEERPERKRRSRTRKK